MKYRIIAHHETLGTTNIVVIHAELLTTLSELITNGWKIEFIHMTIANLS